MTNSTHKNKDISDFINKCLLEEDWYTIGSTGQIQIDKTAIDKIFGNIFNMIQKGNTRQEVKEKSEE